MKYLSLIVASLVFISCTRLLIGEKKLTYNESTLYIKPSLSRNYENTKFYIIPVEKINECRYYPNLIYLGSENKYSYFQCCGKLKYRDEITEFALPDSICVNKYPNTIDFEEKYRKKLGYKHRQATIGNNKVI